MENTCRKVDTSQKDLRQIGDFMKVSSLRTIIPATYFGVVFYEVDYYEQDQAREMYYLLSLLVKSDKQVYCSFGRTDMFLLDESADELRDDILRRIKENGELQVIRRSKNGDQDWYCGYFSMSIHETIILMIDAMKYFYSCSFMFCLENEDWGNYQNYVDYKIARNDIDLKIGFKKFKFKYSIFKGLGPDNFYLNYDALYQLPAPIKEMIQDKPVKEHKSILERVMGFIRKLRR